ncbi:MAG TPA: ABC transporter ATP-binding protein [Clostridiaceae bacterium]|nr:ABC transporter ATP-binding protein [Clostridiaceae bacterium]
MNQLKVTGLKKFFGTGEKTVAVLKGISFTVKQGEFVAVMGQSGSGKSTLLYNVSGMERMSAGSVILGGVSIGDLSEDELADLRLRKMGFIFQNNYFLKNLSLSDNIMLPGLYAKELGRDEVRDNAEILMCKMDISELRNRSIETVSRGQLQRAAICRALINDPQILFADEPTGALNSQASAEVLALLQMLNEQGMTILMVTHDPVMVAGCDRILYLKDGLLEDEYTWSANAGAASNKEREREILHWLMARGF